MDMSKIPQTVLMEQFKYELAQIINNGINEYKLPLYMVEYVLRDYLNEVHVQASQEYEAALKQVQEEQAAEQNTPEESTVKTVEE
jgi:hypothetical protein